MSDPVGPNPVAVPVFTHQRLAGLVHAAQARSTKTGRPRIGIVFPGDVLAFEAAAGMLDAGLATPVLIGAGDWVRQAAAEAGLDASRFEQVDAGESPAEAGRRATAMVRDGDLQGLMKGSLHTDEFMSAIVDRQTGLRGETRITHAFVFDLPRYHKLLALADCVVNIAPNIKTKQDILTNAIALLRVLGIEAPKVGIVAAVETVNPAIPATEDAQALVEMARQGAWPGAIVDGPFGFDNAISAEAARIKKITSVVPGDADLLLMPDLNAGNMLYKSFNYIGGGVCAGLVLGATVPVVLTSRADSLQSRIASVALAVLASTADR